MTSAQRILVNGNEAVAWAAAFSGVDFFAHYPGSPVNQIEPALKKLNHRYHLDIAFNDALNEHVATLAAAGASYCGARSMVVMKHVGMNIAADPLNFIGYPGVKGGMVIVVGTDPGATCSTGEQDVHWYVSQTNFPLFEPCSIAEIYSHTTEAFSLSERYEVPVYLFLPARLCFNSDLVDFPVLQRKQAKPFYFHKNHDAFINVGQKSVHNHRRLLERMEVLSQGEGFVKESFNRDATIGILTRGLAYNHVYEAVVELGLSSAVHVMNLDLVHPLPMKILQTFFQRKKELLFVEDQDGFLESQVKMRLFNEIQATVHGKDIFPAYGELRSSAVADYLAERFSVAAPKNPAISVGDIPERLGTFCEGCPHRSSFYAMERAFAGTDTIIGGDIGCSSLPPHRTDWLLCMNAGVGIAQGMSQVLGDTQPVMSTGGDGSFFHAGLLSLQSAVMNKINLLHIVFDNRSVAMTGHQASPSADDSMNYRSLLAGIGVTDVIEVSAFEPLTLTNRIKQAMKKKGVRVLWVLGDCALQPNAETIIKRHTKFLKIDNEQCGSCTICYSDLQCPAIERLVDSSKNLTIDMDRCMRCGVCVEICPNEAIQVRFETKPSEVSCDETV